MELEIVAENLSPRREIVTPDYAVDSGFTSSWWHRGSAKSPVSYCRFLAEGEEVGRAKVLPGAGEYMGYSTWSCPIGGVTEIDLIEIRVDRRRSGASYGRIAVETIAQFYGEPLVAMSLDDASDSFWQRLGWTAHEHPDNDERGFYRTLFTSV